MLRTALALLLGGLCLHAGTGCKNLAETKAINQFTAAVTAGDLERLRALTTDDFGRKALRLEESADDIKSLSLPTEEVEVVEVHDDEEGAKVVKVEVGKSRRNYHFRLVQDAESKKWLVDDVFMNQTRDGAVVVKTVTEQMDLLLSVREFHSAWTGDERERVLGVVTPEFREVLAELPPAQLSQLVAMAMGDGMTKLRISKSTIDNEVAVITLPRRSGKTIVTCKLLEEGWRVSDLAVEKGTDEDHLPSVQKAATALRAAVNFLDAYGRGDKLKLSEATGAKFFTGSLAAADLTEVPLPGPGLGEYEFKMVGKGARLVIPRETDVVTVSLSRPSEDVAGPVRYYVDEVTIYKPDADEGRTQDMRLSALFTGRAVMQVFADALARRDLATLCSLSSSDFAAKAWQKLDEDSIAHMDVLNLDAAPPEVIDTTFKGAVTELTVTQGNQTLTYVLIDTGGEVKVHDVLVPVPGRPESLKTTMELLIPVRGFAGALAASELGAVQRFSSDHLNRMVWNQSENVPPAAKGAMPHLRLPLRAVGDAGNNRVIISLGTEDYGARVLLVTEHNQRVVDEIQLISGPGQQQQAMFKKSLQQILASGGRRPEAPGAILPASFETPAAEPAPPLPVPEDDAFSPPPTAAASSQHPASTDWSAVPPVEASLPSPVY